MKKILDLKTERSEIIKKMETITSGETLSDEQRSEWTGLDTQIKSIEENIALLERQEQLNKNNIVKMENTEQKVLSTGERFMNWLQDFEKTGNAPSFRINPITATTETDLLNHTVACPDLMLSPAESLLRGLGVTFMEKLNGAVVLPYLAQDTASFVAEGVCNGDVSMNFPSITLAPRRITASQAVTKEFLSITNPCIYQTVLQDLVNSLYNGIAADFFDVMEVDGVTRISVHGAAVDYQNILSLEASVGCYDLTGVKFVTSPTGKMTLRNLNAGSAGIKFAWTDDNTLIGYPALSTCFANANRVYAADWSKTVVATFGEGIELIVDPYTYKKCGKIEITALMLADSGLWNPNAIAILDASLS
jgi:hypothetical protein